LSSISKRRAAVQGRLKDQQAALPAPEALAPDFTTAVTIRATLERTATAVAGRQLAPSQAAQVIAAAALAVKLAELQLESDLLQAELTVAAEPRGRRQG
jgi:hypothetical protein